jgi:hypothetical protein
MPRIIHTNGKKADRFLPKFNRKIANDYLAQAGNLVSKFDQLERNKAYVEKIVSHGVDDGVLIFADHKKLERLEKQQTAMNIFLTPDVKKGHKYWNKGSGLNPFLAMYMYQNRNWVVKKPSELVKRLIRI